MHLPTPSVPVRNKLINVLLSTFKNTGCLGVDWPVCDVHIAHTLIYSESKRYEFGSNAGENSGLSIYNFHD